MKKKTHPKQTLKLLSSCAGFVAILDEECLRPGETNDMTLLERLDRGLSVRCVMLSYKGGV
jgi:hypothetical protein